MKKNLLLIFSCIFAITLSSCEATRHFINNLNIEREHKNCLENAKSDAEREACDSRYEQAKEEENDRHENAVNAEKEIDNCEKYQKYVLMAWGYSEAESKEIAKKMRKCSIDYNTEYKNGQYIKIPYLSSRIPKNDNYSFDCDDAIKELLLNRCTDKEGTQVFAEALPSFGLSISDADQAIKTYYDDGLYVNNDNPYHLNSPVDQCLANVRIGRNIKVTKKLLIDLGLLDEDEDDDSNNDDDSDGNNDDDGDDSNQPSPNPTNPGTGDYDNNYQIESSVISNLTISQYSIGEVELSLQQQQELDAVVDFMKKWPKAKITIVGHTCNIGTQKANQNVGERRAKEAKYYLIIKGIEGLRIQTESRDYSYPVTDNDSEEHRKQNRRVTFEVN